MSKIYIKNHSFYDDFPDNLPVEGEPYIECFMGDFCHRFGNVPPNSIAILLEPRSIEPNGYRWIENHPNVFRHIWTYDDELLKLPQSHFLLWASLWCRSDMPKTKNISMVSSDKTCCELHKARIELAKYFDKGSLVDCFGTFRGNKDDYVDAFTAHAEYKFAIAIENDISDYWFTEKILNCFSTKTVPIYHGARKIREFFNADGIIQVEDWHDIPRVVENLDIDAEYAKRKEAIEENYYKCLPYGDRWRDRFFRDYGDILEGMMDELYNNQ
jgi:hypothetical protein